MKKIFYLLLALVATTSLWASNVITYTATSKLPETTSTYSSGLHTNAFNVSVSSHTFSNDIGTITFADEVTLIGDYAFFKCSGLTSITIPESVTTIGNDAFYDCSGLTSVTIPNSVTEIGNYAFYNCSGLTSVTIPNSVTEIGNYAFYNCSGLTSVMIGNSVTEIGMGAFYNCSGLIEVTIPSSVITIGYSVFDGCNNLTSVTIPNSVITIGDYAFSHCSGLTSITIPNSVTTIGSRAFYGCSGLTSIEIPNSVTTIGWDAFRDCRGLTSVTIGNSVESIGSSAFYGCSGLTSVIIPQSVTTIEEWAFYNCSGLTSVTIGNSVTTIGKHAFSGCSSLTLIDVEEANVHYSSTDGVLFNYTQDILIQYPIGNTRTIYSIPNSITTIGERAFQYCSILTSVEIPNSVTTIEQDAFYGCSGLTSVTIPNSVTEVGWQAFSGCSAITSISVDENNSNFDSRDNCNAIIETSTNTLILGCMNTTIPKNISDICSLAFDGCTNLTSITIPNSVQHIGYSAFFNCTNLMSISCLSKVPPFVEEWDTAFFYNTPRYIPLYVPASSIPAYQAAFGWNEFDIQSLLVDVNPITPDTTQLSWLPVDSASLYKLRIYSEQIELDTTLLIEADSLNGGIRIPVTLAPNRDRRMPMDDISSIIIIIIEPRSGITTETPFVVTVSTTSKDKIDVGFDLEVLKGETTIKQESGSFTFNAPIPDGLDEIPFSRWGSISGIYDLYGHRYSPNQWNQLPAGIYILRDGEKASRVMKR